MLLRIQREGLRSAQLMFKFITKPGKIQLYPWCVAREANAADKALGLKLRL